MKGLGAELSRRAAGNHKSQVKAMNDFVGTEKIEGQRARETDTVT